ncbi:MAG: hypothetical protein ACREOG_13920 [Gemmatimonadaceae bacterium]
MQRFALCFAILASGGALCAQSPRRLNLDAPDATLSRPFTRITALRELPDGRLLVADDREGEMVVADLRAQSVTAVGRRGQGPGEYLRPLGLIALPDGRTLLQDPGNARFLTLDANGRIHGAVAPQRAAASSKPNTMLGLSIAWDIRGSDRLGRVYFEQLPPAQLRPAEVTTVPIVRWDVERRVLDTVASYRLTEAMLSQSVQSGKPGEVLVRPRAWVARPQWTVSPNGAIAIVEPHPYRVVWIDASGRRTGTPVPYTAQPVTEADREWYLDELGAAQSRSRASRGAPEPRRPGTAQPTMKRGGTPIFPAVFPAFVGRDAVRIDPDGAVWVARAASVTDSTPVYDVFDGAARRHTQAHLRAQSRIVGFGARAIYVARRDSDDLEYLERYRR